MFEKHDSKKYQDLLNTGSVKVSSTLLACFMLFIVGLSFRPVIATLFVSDLNHLVFLPIKILNSLRLY